jgi:ABC-type glycerol-3-phosphate transport system substrate-binding protein
MLFFRKRTVVLLLTICFALIVSACGSGAASTSDGSGGTSNDKPKLTLMISWPGDPNGKVEEELVAKQFGDKYDITFKPADNNLEKTIKTTIASGEPLDLVVYWPGEMATFVNANMALDLTPYLDENNGEWRNTFVDGVMSQGTYNGKVYAVSNTPAIPVLEVNKDILDQAGVTLSDHPTWDEFKQALVTIKEKTGITPLGLPKDWASWSVRELLYSVWPDDAKLLEWSKGQIPFTDSHVVKVFDEVKDIYDKELVYPGKGALTTTLDQVNVAFKTGKIAIKANVNFQSAQSIKDAGLNNVQILSWPHLGSRTKVMGATNGYMIPANVKHPEASVEILKFLTSAEVMQHRVDNGSPVTVKGVKSDDPNFAQYSKDIGNLYTEKEVQSLSTKLGDYMSNNMPANYIFDGMKSLEELDKLRLEAIQERQ